MEFARSSYRTVFETVLTTNNTGVTSFLGLALASCNASMAGQSPVDGRAQAVQWTRLDSTGAAASSMRAQQVVNTALSAAGVTSLNFVLGTVSLQVMSIGGVSYAQFALVGDAGFDDVSHSSTWFPTTVLANFTCNLAGFGDAVFNGETVILTETDIECLSGVFAQLQAVQQVELSAPSVGEMVSYTQSWAYAQTTITCVGNFNTVAQPYSMGAYAIAGVGEGNLITLPKQRVYGAFSASGAGQASLDLGYKAYKAAQFAAPSVCSVSFDGNQVVGLDFQMAGSALLDMRRGKNVLKLMEHALVMFPRKDEVRDFIRPVEIRTFRRNT